MKQPKPWDPRWMLILVLFFWFFILNFVIAGLISGFNYTRLDKPEERKRIIRYTLIGFIIIFIIGIVIQTTLHSYPLLYEFLCWVIIGTNIVIVIYLVQKQLPYYTEWKLKNAFKREEIEL